MISRNALACGFGRFSLHVPGVQSLVAEQRKLSGEELKFRAATGGLVSCFPEPETDFWHQVRLATRALTLQIKNRSECRKCAKAGIPVVLIRNEG